MPLPHSSLRYSPVEGSVEGYDPTRRRLSDLGESFADRAAYENALRAGDEVIYQVTNIEAASGAGQLHYALGKLLPGKVGQEYFLTRGHLHAWRPAAEVYICLSGRGMMLLEDAANGDCQAVELTPDQVVYVPGNTAHRTINTGSEALIYWGVLSCDAGHDYAYVGEHNFRQVVVECEGKPVVMDRKAYLQSLSRGNT